MSSEQKKPNDSRIDQDRRRATVPVENPAVRAYSCDMLLQLCTLEGALIEKRGDVRRIKELVHAAARRKQRISEMRQQVEAKAAHVEQQKQQLVAQTRKVEEASNFTEELREQKQWHESQSQAVSTGLALVPEAISTAMVKLKQDRIISEDLRAMLARRRAVFAQQLVEIFPIEMVSGELAEDERLRWSICGLRIRNPDKVTGWEANEETAAALGLVVRLLDAISRYNNIALRFPVVPLGSRSVVCNPVAKAFSIQTEWPLFMLKASDRPRLHTGIRLLETNVEQLLCQLGVQDVDRKQMLPNLVQLLMTIEGCSFAR